MKISTRSQYALIALVDIALQPVGRFTTVRDIANRQNISHDYLQMLIGCLNTHEIVISKRGRDGGHTLARELDEITLFDVFTAVGESFCPLARRSNTDGLEAQDLIDEVWDDLCTQTAGYLKSITLNDVVYSQVSLGKTLFPQKPAHGSARISVH